MRSIYTNLFSAFVAFFLVFSIAPASPNEPSKVLDEVLWQSYNTSTSSYSDSEKELYNYSENGALLSSVLYTWNADKRIWVESDRVTYSYSNNLLMVKTYSSYNKLSSSWADIYKHEFTYDTNGNLLSDYTYDKVGTTDVWYPSSKQINTYDSNGNLLSLIFSTKDGLLLPWVDTEKILYTYNSDQLITSSYSEVWDELLEDWVAYDRESYTYSNEGKTIEYVYQLWNEISQNWDNYYKDFSEYYNNDLNYGFLSSYWDETTSKWYDLSKELHTFDANNRLLTYEEYDWNSSNSRWVFVDKEVYTYDNNGNMLSFIDYNKASNSNSWVYGSKELYTYDLSVLLSDIYLPYEADELAGFIFTNQLNTMEHLTWNSSTSAWVKSEKGLFSYSNLSTPTLQFLANSNNISVYPTVTSDRFFITSSELGSGLSVEIYSVNGLKVLRQSLQSSPQFISINSLSTGVYLVKISQDGHQILDTKVLRQ